MRLRHSISSAAQLDRIYVWSVDAGNAVDDALDRIEAAISGGGGHYRSYATAYGVASYVTVSTHGRTFIIIWDAQAPQYIVQIGEL